MILVLDSSALIALARIERLNLIHELAEEVLIPEAVFDEVAGRHRVGGDEVRRASWLRVKRIADRDAAERLCARLGRGEAESIVLAREVSPDFIVLDDATARSAAQALGLRVIGLLGLLVVAKERGVAPMLKPVLQELRATGFFISDSLSLTLLRQVGEASEPHSSL